MFRCSWKFSVGKTQKSRASVSFTFQPEFPEMFVNGKQSISLSLFLNSLMV